MDSTRQRLAHFFTGDEASRLLADFDPSHIPTHIAVIMDGNGRWAKERGLPRIAGHKAGAAAVKELIAAALEVGVPYLTVYSFSSENWKRPADEVSGLMRLFVEVLQREMANLEARGVRVIVLGDLTSLPKPTRSAFEDVERSTASNTGMTLAVALNYGGRDEIVKAVRDIAHDVLDGVLRLADIDEASISSRLYTADIPDPDLVLRTSGEQRLSNFLPWQTVYSELHFTDVLWPDFTRTHLLAAIADYQTRSRRFGASS